MKKRLAAAITTALVVGVASTTFAAANPFVDVPAKHWSYDAVTKLAQAGIVDGYGDGTFRGDKTITRYEMAQIVAKALAKSDKADAEQKAAIDKLAVEYSAELNNLGVRVAKLEANQSKIKFSGDVRLRYVDDKIKDDTVTSERFRLAMKADVNDKTSFYGRFVGLNHNEMGTSGADTAFVSDAALTTKDVFNSGAELTVGRFSQWLGSTGFLADTTGGVDGAKVTVGNKLKVTAGYADFTKAAGNYTFVDDNGTSAIKYDDVTATASKLDEAVFVEAKYSFNKATSATATYLEERNGDLSQYKIAGAGFVSKFTKNFAVSGDYYQNSEFDNDPTAWIAKISYKGANAAKPQSFGIAVDYRKTELGSIPSGLTTSSVPLFATGDVKDGDVTAKGIEVAGLKGWTLTADYTLAKNIVLNAYQTFDTKAVDNDAVKVDDYTRVQVNFMF